MTRFEWGPLKTSELKEGSRRRPGSTAQSQANSSDYYYYYAPCSHWSLLFSSPIIIVVGSVQVAAPHPTCRVSRLDWQSRWQSLSGVSKPPLVPCMCCLFPRMFPANKVGTPVPWRPLDMSGTLRRTGPVCKLGLQWPPFTLYCS